PGPWPVNNEPTAVLASGDVVRLGEGRTLYVYSTVTGKATVYPIPELGKPTAKAGQSTLTVTSRDNVVVSSASLGRVVVLTQAGGGFTTTSVVSYQRSRYLGGPVRKTALSGNANTVYVLGGPKADGITAYDIKTGEVKATTEQPTQYVGVSVLPSQEVLAVDPTVPAITVLTPDLKIVASVKMPIPVVEVF
ncbi:MAG: NHL repeat-containing protein, partial [Sulfobacillus sp.]